MKFVASLCAASLIFAAPAFAEDKPNTPTTLPGGKVITVEEAKKLSDDKSAQFFDTRNLINFGKGHVPGAKAVSYKEKSKFEANFDAAADSFELDKLPADKAAKIVIYSDGPAGWKSYKAAVLSIKAGHKNVMWMRDGFGGWSAKGYPAE